MPATRAIRRARTAGAAVRPATARARQQRGVRTEEAILGATLRLLAARGVHGTSLDLLAEEVGVAKSSILWHFGSKEELLMRVAERVFEEVARGPAQEILALPTLEQRSAATWRFYADTLRHKEGRPELRARLQQLYRGMRELFAEGLRGVVADPEKRRRLATLSIAALDGIFLQWLLDPASADLESLQREMRTLAEQAQAPRRRSSHHP
jgi:AcrR family transcriptional regulator